MRDSQPSTWPILWRRLDVPGHDAAMVRQLKEGAELRGMAVFSEGETPNALRYTVRCDGGWRTIAAMVEGWSGTRAVDLRFRRTRAGEWTLNGEVCLAVAGCIDLDLNFTPATNLLPLRRLNLEPGESAEVRSAWLEWPAVRLSPLVQRYTRRSRAEYDYEADLPGGERFAGMLHVDPSGWVRKYASLWQAEPI